MDNRPTCNLDCYNYIGCKSDLDKVEASNHLLKIQIKRLDDNLKELGDIEQLRVDSFKQGHICPDRKHHDGITFEVTHSYSNLSGIGTNHYIKCERCGGQQEVTDYGSW